MNFIEKKTIHDRLLGVTHMDADRELLKKHSPGHKLIGARTFNPISDASSLLWVLLDFAPEDDILTHRRKAISAFTASEEAAAKEAEDQAIVKAAEEAAAQKAKEDAAKAAEEASTKAEEEEDEKKLQEEDAKKTADEIISDAENQADEIREQAESEADEILATAEQQAESIKQSVGDDVKKKLPKKSSTPK